MNGTPQEFAIWDTQYRNVLPRSRARQFSSGDSQQYDLDGNPCTPSQCVTCGLGLRRNYYSWTWGDALFVVFDPLWNETPDTNTSSLGNGQDCCQKGTTETNIFAEHTDGLVVDAGGCAVSWVASTLAASTAKYKFVFSHNLVGGWNYNGGGAMRGGIEAARYSEWGGYNLDGTYGFTKYRPSMAMPLHQLLLKYNVTAFFHGHDHRTRTTGWMASSYRKCRNRAPKMGPMKYRSPLATVILGGTIHNGRGYLRVKVDPSAGVTTQFVQTWLPTEVREPTTNVWWRIPGPSRRRCGCPLPDPRCGSHQCR